MKELPYVIMVSALILGSSYLFVAMTSCVTEQEKARPMIIKACGEACGDQGVTSVSTNCYCRDNR